MRLFITEKFSVARVIATALATARHHSERQTGYFSVGDACVTWTGGTLIELAAPESYDEKYRHWRMEQLPIFPSPDPADSRAWKYVERAHHSGQLGIIRELRCAASEIVHAGAIDREGQWHIDELLGYLQASLALADVPVKRLLLEDMNVAAVRLALQDLRDNNAFAAWSDSARARSHADWLYGINMTRAYTLLARHSGYDGERALAIGRVQTPVLEMIVRRDESIEQFKVHPVVELIAKIASSDGRHTCLAHWQPAQEAGQCDKVTCEQLANQLLDKKGVVVSRREQDIVDAPPLPHDFAALHIACAGRYGYSASDVEEACRQLYEKHHLISYPFVDSRVLPEEKFTRASDIIETVLAILHHLASKQAHLLEAQVKQADCWLKRECWKARKADRRQAIMPVETVAEKVHLDEKELNVYLQVVQNFVAQFFPDALHREVEVVFAVGSEHFAFSTTQVTQPGWRVLFTGDAIVENSSHGTRVQEYTEWQVNQVIQCENVSVREKLARAPERFTEVAVMEAMSSLAAHSSRASTIAALVERGYILKGNRHLFSTQLGKDIVHALPGMDTVALSMRWENQLSAIAEGQLGYAEFMTAFRNDLAGLVAQVRQKKTMSITSADKVLGLPGAEKFNCPRCHAVLLLRHGKHGEFWGCSRYPDCKQTLPDKPDSHGQHAPDFRLDENHTRKIPAKNPADRLGKNCPDCGKPLVRRSSKHGYFAGCSGFPACKHTEAWSGREQASE